jgi:hypothetical protein
MPTVKVLTSYESNFLFEKLSQFHVIHLKECLFGCLSTQNIKFNQIFCKFLPLR